MVLGDFIQGLSAGDIGFAGLLSLAIFLILTGRLVPRTTVDDMRADYASRLKEKQSEAEDWKEAYKLESAVGVEQGKQIGELLEFARTTDHMIRAIQTTAVKSGVST